jgi:lipoprotein-anchoring transpeptidase ErfK/SrfK
MTVTRLSPSILLGPVVAALALLAAGCGGGSMHGVAGERKALVRHCAAGVQRPVGSAEVAVAAVVTRRTTAYREPGGRALASFGLLNVNGVPTVFGVVGQRLDTSCRPAWLHVQLPIRPNGATGWVRADHVETAKLRTRIVIDLSERRVRFYKRGRLVLSSGAAVGSSATPTPLGRYYVNQRLIPSERGGPFGPGAVGISAFSPVLTGWAQGGPIAIHGTNEPWSIGRAVSNGCIRLPNAVLLKLFRQTAAGTPVLIRQ